MDRILRWSNFLNENSKYNRKIYGYSWNELYYIIEDEIDDPEEFLNYLIKKLKKIEKEEKINLYRIVFAKNKDDIDVNKLGHHFVQDPKDFHEEMNDYLFRNARKENSELEETDLFLVEVEIETKYIDFEYTIMTNCQHPFESEITVEKPEKCVIKNITEYYDN